MPASAVRSSPASATTGTRAWLPLGAGAALLVAVAALAVATALPGCSTPEGPAGRASAGLWPLAKKQPPQPRTMDEWMSQQRPTP